MNIHDQDLGKNAANFVALSPVSFVERSGVVFADLPERPLREDQSARTTASDAKAL